MSLRHLLTLITERPEGQWLVWFGSGALLVEVVSMIAAVRRWRLVVRASTRLTFGRWLEALAGTALVPVPIFGLATVQRQRLVLLRAFLAPETSTFDRSYRVRALSALGLQESATLWCTVIFATLVVVVGVPALVLAQAARLPTERRAVGPLGAWWGTSVLLGLVLVYLPLSFGASRYLGELVSGRFNGACGDPALMLAAALEDASSAAAAFRGWAIFAVFGGCIAVTHAAWATLRCGDSGAIVCVRSWRWTSLVSGCCVLLGTCLYLGTRSLAWENHHPLPIDWYASTFIGQRVHTIDVRGDIDSLHLSIAGSAVPFADGPLIELSSAKPNVVHLDGAEVSPAEAQTILRQKRELWQQINPQHVFPGVILVYCDGNPTLASVTKALRSAANAGYRSVFFDLPYRIQHQHPILGSFKTVHHSILRASLAGPSGSAVSSRQLPLAQLDSYQTFMRQLAALRPHGEVSLGIGE